MLDGLQGEEYLDPYSPAPLMSPSVEKYVCINLYIIMHHYASQGIGCKQDVGIRTTYQDHCRVGSMGEGLVSH